MSNVWATMPCVQLSHMLVNCIDNRQNQLFSEMSLRDVMELPNTAWFYVAHLDHFKAIIRSIILLMLPLSSNIVDFILPAWCQMQGFS